MNEKEKELLDTYNSLSNSELSQLTEAEQTEYGDLLEKSKAPQTTETKSPSTGYSYLPGDYEDLRRNVGEVGFSGLDERQQALFKSQFPQSKFAKAGGSFDDAVKYVDSQSNQGKMADLANNPPYPVMESALPGEYSIDPNLQEFVKKHPGTSLATLASVPLTGGSTVPAVLGGMGVSAVLGGGGTYVDERLAGNPDAAKASLFSGLVSGATHGLGAGASWLGKKIAAPVIEGLARQAESKAASEAFAEGLKQTAVKAQDAELRLVKAIGKGAKGEAIMDWEALADMKADDVAELANMDPEKLRKYLQQLPEPVKDAVYWRIADMMRRDLPQYSSLGKVRGAAGEQWGALIPSEGEVGKYVMDQLTPYTAKGMNLIDFLPYSVTRSKMGERIIGETVPDWVTNNFFIPKAIDKISPFFTGLGRIVGPTIGQTQYQTFK